ncbi:DUF6169 family protein [Dyadobacter sp. CY261]|uniref:DUF6169 family protein n=1 Tax=Dyadobacter sp. CY261 TaxID=2907203 RepID=UPI001F2B29F3|nr:DUF6169 family protein [Dyadobacter sp. CY261]MCF0071210.1 DUF6169 family protein [Dyadobacter sp. CY261]
MESNFSEIYPYQSLGKYYQFTTAQNIVVHLFLDPKWFPDNPEIAEACSFFILTNKPSIGVDIRLRNTVLDILANFLKENEPIIIYHCDPHDGKGHKRFTKFNRWSSLINDQTIEKHDRQVIVKDLKIDEDGNCVRSELVVYASLLLRKTHPNYEAAIRIFYSGDLDQTGKL